MGLGRYVVDAIVLEGRSPSEVARSHGISRSWIYELVARSRLARFSMTKGSAGGRTCAANWRPLTSAVSCATASVALMRTFV